MGYCWARDSKLSLVGIPSTSLEAQLRRLCDTYVSIMGNISDKRSGKNLFLFVVCKLTNILTFL